MLINADVILRTIYHPGILTVKYSASREVLSGLLPSVA